MIEAITTSMTAVWILTAALALLLFIAAASDSFAAAFWFTVIGLAVLQFVTVADPWGFVASHPRMTIAAALAYLPIGVGWSMFRWWKLLQKSAAVLKSEKQSWKPGTYYKSWDEYIAERLPTASRNKERIVCWIAYWPFSIAAYLLIDFLQEAAEWVYARISRIYTSMADKVKASLKD